MTQSIKTLVPLALGVLVLLGYSFLGAQAPANPPSGNTSSPINTSATSQTKIGPLIIGGLTTASSSLSVNGNATIFSTIPSLVLYDENTGQAPYRLRVDADYFQLLTDHDKDGDWFDTESPLVIFSSSTNTNLDNASFANEVRADEFCNKSGDCLVIPSSASGLAVADVVRTKRIANALGAGRIAAIIEWNTVINATYGNHPSQSSVTATRDMCTWEAAENHPTSGNTTSGRTQEEALETCATFICGYHPTTNIGFALKESSAYHGGDSGSNAGVYEVDCFY